jgi:hypothetical protein
MIFGNEKNRCTVPGHQPAQGLMWLAWPTQAGGCGARALLSWSPRSVR